MELPLPWFHPSINSTSWNNTEICVQAQCTHRIRISIHTFLCEGIELLVERMPSFPFTLLQLDLVFITVSVLPLPVPRLVELDVRRFAIELNVLK
jgi:hypothetical protein